LKTGVWIGPHSRQKVGNPRIPAKYRWARASEMEVALRRQIKSAMTIPEYDGIRYLHSDATSRRSMTLRSPLSGSMHPRHLGDILHRIAEICLSERQTAARLQ
jgi:hypothetical protein